METKEYPVYRGLQKPLVMFGLRGPNIITAAVTFFGTFVIFGVILWLFNSYLLSFFFGAACAGVGLYRIWLTTKRGLYNKKKYKGVWVVKNVIHRHV